jgi:arabinogalactan oligomer/maltooligosaccharide transport system permease protein
LWHAYRGAEAEALEQLARAHGAEVLALPFGAYANKLRHAIPFGHGPDVFVLGHDQLGDFVRRDLVAKVPEPTEFLGKTVEALRVDGQLYGWPLAYKFLALYYRTDRVAAAPRTLAELQALDGLVYPSGDFYFHAPWFLGFGADFAVLDSAAAVRSGELLQAFLQKMPRAADSAMVTELFNKGRATTTISGPWFASEVAADVPYSVVPLPPPARPLCTVDGLFVAKGRGGAAAEALLSALTTDSAAALRANVGRQSVANVRAPSDPFLDAFRAGLDAAVLTPKEARMSLLWEPMAEALRAIASGRRTPERALARAAKRVRVLEKPAAPTRSARPFALALLGLIRAALAWLLRHLCPADLWRSRHAYVFLLPTAVGMALVVLVPLAVGVGLGFYDFDASQRRFVGMGNFVDILAARDYSVTDSLSFYFSLAVTVFWTIANVALHVVIGATLALLLNGRGVFLRAPLRVLLILPWAIPNYITALVFKGLFNSELGAVNAVLGTLGVAPVGWFDSFLPAFTANLCANVWLGFPFMMVTTLGALQSIPAELYDAAHIDGATRWQRLRYITLPMLRPALGPAVVLGTLWTFNMFNVVYLVSEGEPDGATNILVTEAYAWAFTRNGRYGYAAAYSLIIFSILLLYGRWSRRWIRA